MVNEYLQTSDPLIYAGGDCVEVTNLITGKSGYWPLGSLANRQGRVIGTNICGGRARFDGAVGSFAIKLFDICICSAGLSLKTAERAGIDAISAFVVQFDRAHFYPEKELVYLELVVEKNSGRVLGIHGFGGKESGVLARVASVASILKYSPSVSDIGNLEFPYSPPFSSAMDVVNALGNTAENLLSGKNKVIDAWQFLEMWESGRTDGEIILDCRGIANAQPFVEKYPECWKSVPQDELRTRMDEIPDDRKLILVCNTGVRAYEAQITLDHEGIKDTYNLQGGVAALKKMGLELP
jgi:rhodanese-related sulfurtransferase